MTDLSPLHRLAQPRPVRSPRGTAALLRQLADRGGVPDDPEQPRSRGRREPGCARRLRRHRQGGAQLGLLRGDPGVAEEAEGRRDPAGAERQAGRRVPHPRRRAAGPDRQLEPGAEVGHLGALRRARPQGPDDVRPDDRGLVDLHRQPGHRPGHLRDLRRGRPAALRRQPRRPLDPHRRARRHGRGAAAGRHLRRRGLAHGRVPAEPDRLSPALALPRRAGRRTSTTRWRGSRSTPPRSAPSRSACSAMPPRCCPSWCGAASGPTW